MRKKPTRLAETCRVASGPLASTSDLGNNGAFGLPCNGVILWCIVSDQEGWDHVSVHADGPNGERCPTWDEMCFVRKTFFAADEWVMQLHPPPTKNINVHPFTLHLWRPQKAGLPLPPEWMV